MRSTSLVTGLVWPLLALFSNGAFAHHVSDGALPSTFTEGMLSGLAHPVIGPDHLAFMIGLGLVAYLVKKPIQLPLLFVGGTLAGCFLHLYSFDLPLLEPIIASTVLLFGALVGFKLVGAGGMLWLPAAIIAGVFHGYAYAESIIGAVNSALTAYLIGFALIQFAVAHVVARLATAVPVLRDHISKLGFALAAVGGYFLVNAI